VLIIGQIQSHCRLVVNNKSKNDDDDDDDNNDNDDSEAIYKLSDEKDEHCSSTPTKHSEEKTRLRNKLRSETNNSMTGSVLSLRRTDD